MKSPFKFLDSYTLADRDVFFGRDQEITELYRRVFESKMLLVYGISGTGKSSLINCGLASRFDDSDWLPVNVRRGNNIIESINDAFNKKALSPFKKNLSFSEKLQSIYLDHFKPVFLIFDQFEELFIFGTTEEKTEFIKLIKEVICSKTQARVIFIIREEFLAGITEFEYEIPDIFSNRFRVEKMKRANAISAVEGPCKVYKIETEPGFSEELIDKLCPSGNDIELTYLQIYLDKLFRLTTKPDPVQNTEHRAPSTEYRAPSTEHRAPSTEYRAPSTEHRVPDTEHPVPLNIKFSNDLLSKAGSVSDLLGQFLDEQIREFDDPETAMTILKSFVSVQGTKKQMTEAGILDSISTFGTTLSEQDLLKYLEKFVDLRILRERDEAGNFELRHDALAAKIYEQFTISEKELLEVRLFVENAFLAFNTRQTYLNSEDLEYITNYEKKLFLPQALSQFISDSKVKLQMQQRALSRLTRIVAFVFLILVGMGFRYYIKQKDTAKTKELITVALLEEKVDPLASIKTAFTIYQKDSMSIIVKGIILNSFNSLLQRKLEEGTRSIPKMLLPRAIPAEGSVLSLCINKSGSCIFGWTDKNEVFFNNLSDSVVRSFRVDDEIVSVEMSDNGEFVAVVYLNNKSDVFNIGGKKIFSFKTTLNKMINDRLVRFFPLGKYFLAAVKDSMVVIYDSTGKPLFNLTGHNGTVNSLDISPDGRFIVTASSDKKVLIWNFNYKDQLFSTYDTIGIHKDTVWSCEFSRKGNFILAASADSTFSISSLNGVTRDPFYTYATNYPEGISIFYKGFKKIQDSIHSFLDPYNKKIFNASFAANDSAIITSNYSYNKNSGPSSEGIFRNQVVYFGASSNDFYYSDRYFYKGTNRSISGRSQFFRLWRISYDRLLFAALEYQKEGIIILTPNGFQLTTINGDFPIFSKYDETLIYIFNKSIRMIPLKTREIRNLVFEKKVFGDIENSREIWSIL
jgi:WD40 repeat protein